MSIDFQRTTRGYIPEDSTLHEEIFFEPGYCCVFDTRPEGTRKIGRPKLRWEDGVIQDIRVLGVKNWRNVAMDREDWRKLLKRARAHTGLSSQW
jgi:hypothetical protein